VSEYFSVALLLKYVFVSQDKGPVRDCSARNIVNAQKTAVTDRHTISLLPMNSFQNPDDLAESGSAAENLWCGEALSVYIAACKVQRFVQMTSQVRAALG
jgi:predicted small integral membrane protein